MLSILKKTKQRSMDIKTLALDFAEEGFEEKKQWL